MFNRIVDNRITFVSFLLAAMLGHLFGCRQPLAIRTESYSSLQRLDPQSAVKDAGNEILWYDASRLTIEGKGWTATESFYDRLPVKAKGVVTKGVWGLSKDSSGMAIRFVTDAGKIMARWTLTSENLAMNHMPATGVSGLDLYVKEQDVWHWIGVGRPTKTPTNEVTLVEGVPNGVHEYMLYLPLYNGVKTVELGIASKTFLAVAPARPPGQDKPVCVYGTSIVQGGCASRPGMAHVAILGRMLDRPTINLGFSGNGKMEPEMASLLAELDVAVYVLDCLPNMTADMVAERVVPFVQCLSKARPGIPIILVENVIYQNGYVLPRQREAYADKNLQLRQACQRLQSQGTRDLHYVTCEQLLGVDGEATVDGCHPTDLGFWRFAAALRPEVRKVLR